MPLIVGIKFKSSARMYYFNPLNITFEEGDAAIVETVRGLEYGAVVMGNKEVSEDDIVQPLKPVVRKANAQDDKRYADLLQRQAEAMTTAEERIAAHKINMKLVSVEYTFDGKKLIIYFTAPSRVDFRELVKDLAGCFKVRIELRQISERDDIKMRGALASCGRPCCCTSFLPEFERVTLKMAKNQNLSLNPAKISGLCGKLMCCLKYENNFYVSEAKKMPSQNGKVDTVDGNGICIGCDILRGTCKVRIDKAEGYDINEYKVSDIKFTPKKGHTQKQEKDDEDDNLDELKDN